MKKLYKFPLRQHIGSPSIPVVKEGDKVLRGQLIAKMPEEMLGSNLYSSVNGTIEEISDITINIAIDDNQPSDYEKLKSKGALELIKESGLVGLGGAGFPTYAKLQKPFDKDGGTIIINAAECEPILNHNIDSIENDPLPMIKGLKIAMEITNADKGIIAIKEKHTDAIKKVKEAIKDEENIDLFELIDLYPMGEERALIREIKDVLLEVTDLPFVADSIVLNEETASKIYEAVELKKPLIDKDITVAGKLKDGLIHVLHNVPLGISVEGVFDLIGGIGDEYGEIIMGGPFTGKRTHLEDPIVKTTGGLIAAESFWSGPEKLGLLVCACGADEARLKEMAASMGSEVAGIEYCKQAIEMKNGTYKCENPGRCPGQVEKVLKLKKAGAQALLVSNCTDCTNTVMTCAPPLKLPVYHNTDGALRAVNHKLVRKMKSH
ncbi:MAG: proline reductase-associated electron transfer protein PrdC [Tissierellia bacterium]|nr:proline reductase-associated electron transfer protein PrdC [Tissierellia bacterium]